MKIPRAQQLEEIANDVFGQMVEKLSIDELGIYATGRKDPGYAEVGEKVDSLINAAFDGGNVEGRHDALIEVRVLILRKIF